MPHPRPLPAPFVDRPFTVAAARSAGVDADRLRRRDLASPFSGVRVPSGALPAAKLAAVALLACGPTAFLCGGSAAAWHGMPLPPRLARRTAVEVAVPAPGRAIRRRGIIGRVLDVTPAEVVTSRDSVRVTSPPRTWCDLAVQLTVPELVAAGDRLLRSGRVSLGELRSAADARRDRRGMVAIRSALPLLDPRSLSPKESELRALVVLAGFPVPGVNVDIHAPTGEFVAMVDLFFEAFGEILEYQGDHHRTDRRAWRRDRTREAELEALGYHVMEVTDDDLVNPEALLRRIARNLTRRGWRGEPRPLDEIRRHLRIPGA